MLICKGNILPLCVLSVALILVNLQDSRLFALVTRYSLCGCALVDGTWLALSVILPAYTLVPFGANPRLLSLAFVLADYLAL